MHELSIASAVLAAVERAAVGRPVASVRLRVGALRQVVPSSLAFYWPIVARDSVCADARLELHAVPARARCPGCAREWELSEPLLRCAGCGGPATVIAGEELEIESIDVLEDTPSRVPADDGGISYVQAAPASRIAAARTSRDPPLDS
jgi:hydrogenase nickel incorporation protein HypA/HybF